MFTLKKTLSRAFGISASRTIPKKWLNSNGLFFREVRRNESPAHLYERATYKHPANPGTAPSCVTSTGAFAAYSGEKTGRSPTDKRIVFPKSREEEKKIWWGEVNKPLDRGVYENVLDRAKDYLNSRDFVYCVDGFIGADPKYRYSVRIFCTRPYHSLFMHNMLIRPTDQELATEFDDPDFVIYNAGEFYANKGTTNPHSRCVVALDLSERNAAILGTQYAGEMKKGLFSLMHYLMPDRGVVSLHSSATEGPDGDVTLFFGLSGTGKTTLSADPNRLLIGDDEHCWTDEGIFNIEGGCYAKVNFLDKEQEPEIFDAIKFGTVVENVKFSDDVRRKIEFDDISITPNTRAAYPIDFIPNAKVPSIGGHPKNIIFLTCDAEGVLPPVSRLTYEQAMYHFIIGYTCKVAGTEMGVTSPTPIFSACYGEPFLVRHPTVYAEMLAEKIEKHGTKVWMINTGWVNGKFGEGERISLKDTRAIVDAIHNGSLEEQNYSTTEVFNLQIPDQVPGVEDQTILNPENSWPSPEEYKEHLVRLGELFIENFKKYGDVRAEILKGGPKL